MMQRKCGRRQVYQVDPFRLKEKFFIKLRHMDSQHTFFIPQLANYNSTLCITFIEMHYWSMYKSDPCKNCKLCENVYPHMIIALSTLNRVGYYT